MGKEQLTLSTRLSAVAHMVSFGQAVCDVGCDHGYLDIYLVQNGISPRALAMDIRKGPLKRAGEHIAQAGLGPLIETRLSDGLRKYHAGELGDNAALVCTGMGGWLIREILQKDPDKTHDFKALILSPQSDVPMLRRFLRENGYAITDEDLIYEEGIFYPVIKAVWADPVAKEDLKKDRPGTAIDPALEDILGPVLLAKHHPALKLFLGKSISREKEVLKKIEDKGSSGKAVKKAGLIKEELEKAEEIYLGWPG